MAKIISEVLGKPVRFQQMPVEAFKARLTGFGRSEAMAQSTLDMMVAKDEGLDNAEPRTPRVQHADELPAVVRRGARAGGAGLNTARSRGRGSGGLPAYQCRQEPILTVDRYLGFNYIRRAWQASP